MIVSIGYTASLYGVSSLKYEVQTPLFWTVHSRLFPDETRFAHHTFDRIFSCSQRQRKWRTAEKIDMRKQECIYATLRKTLSSRDSQFPSLDFPCYNAAWADVQGGPKTGTLFCTPQLRKI